MTWEAGDRVRVKDVGFPALDHQEGVVVGWEKTLVCVVMDNAGIHDRRIVLESGKAVECAAFLVDELLPISNIIEELPV